MLGVKSGGHRGGLVELSMRGDFDQNTLHAWRKFWNNKRRMKRKKTCSFHDQIWLLILLSCYVQAEMSKLGCGGWFLQWLTAWFLKILSQRNGDSWLSRRRGAYTKKCENRGGLRHFMSMWLHDCVCTEFLLRTQGYRPRVTVWSWDSSIQFLCLS